MRKCFYALNKEVILNVNGRHNFYVIRERLREM